MTVRFMPAGVPARISPASIVRHGINCARNCARGKGTDTQCSPNGTHFSGDRQNAAISLTVGDFGENLDGTESARGTEGGSARPPPPDSKPVAAPNLLSKSAA